MRPVVIDFESYYDPKNLRGDPTPYSLRNMTTESYVRDPRFEAHGAAIKWSKDTSAQWYDQRELAYILKEEDWSDVFLICHHAQFDGFILSHHYDVHPAMFGCTLSMARLLLGNHLSVSLDSVRKHFNLPAKITPYHLFRGKHWTELSPAVQQQIGEGAVDEVESIWKLFGMFMRMGFPSEELGVIDTVIKMFTEPKLVGDGAMFAKVWEQEATRKQNRLDALNISADDLQSSDRFAELLRQQGVEPETKTSPKGNEIYAFAKNDQFMRDLLEDEDDVVRALAEARLGAKSTLLQTRAETLGWMASRGPMPVYLRYSGAATLRFSGGDGCLVAETEVLTLDISGIPKYKKIIDVLLTDLVWDGEEFVEHDGVAFSGYQEIVSWDGINGTSDHLVFCEEAWKDLGEALRDGTKIMDCREPTAWEVEAGRTRQRSRA